MLIGYARKSTIDQKFDQQIDALEKAECCKIFKESISGSKTERPELNAAIEYLRKGDVLVVWRLDRLGRSLKHLIEIITELESKGIGFKSLQESIDTTTSTGKLFFHMIGSFAEFERNLIVERTNAGLCAARSRGRFGGRPKAIDNKTIQAAFKLYDDKQTPVHEILSLLNIKKPTFYKYLKKRSELEKVIEEDENLNRVIERQTTIEEFLKISTHK